MNLAESTKQVLKHPEMIAYCRENLFKIACPDECPHYEKCRSFDFTDHYGTFPNYPYNHIKRAI